ncbi:SpoIIE family protein phosphatase [Thiovibrio sp. JS02]
MRQQSLRNIAHPAEQILEAVNQGLYVTDLERRIVYWNEAAERITGWAAAEVVGRACKDSILVHTDKDGRQLCGKESCPLHRAMVTGNRSTVPSLVFAQKKDGSRLPVQVSVAPIRDGLGTIIGGVEVFQDLSHQARDLERARQIQALSMTLPVNDDPRLRWTCHYAAHDIVGGDYFTVERLAPDRYAFLLADMMGHGVAAALYAMHLHSLWESNRELLNRPAAFLAALNRNLCQLVRDGESFATCLFGLLDPEARQLSLCAAGGPAALLTRGRETRQLKTAGLPLGVMPEAAYEETHIALQPDDGLLFCTDGALEISGTDGRLLGSHGLANLIGLHGFPDTEVKMLHLTEEMLRFSGNIRFPDDLAILAVRCLTPSP